MVICGLLEPNSNTKDVIINKKDRVGFRKGHVEIKLHWSIQSLPILVDTIVSFITSLDRDKEGLHFARLYTSGVSVPRIFAYRSCFAKLQLMSAS